MARPHIEFVHAAEVPLEAIHEGPFAGCAQRVLSRDDESGASTALVSLPGSWSGSLALLDRPLELFCVRGRLELDGRGFGEGCHGWVPSLTAGAPLAALEAALCLVMVEAVRAPTGGPVEIVDSKELPFRDRTIAAVPPGLIVKALRVDPETGDRTWIAAVAPGWEERRAEIHPTVEEAFVLRGDGLLGTRGELTAGCYFWRPPNVRHGPMVTHGGQLVFFRTKGGGIDVTYEDVPGWEELVRAYLAKRPFADGV
jgi:hypothetical protein